MFHVKQSIKSAEWYQNEHFFIRIGTKWTLKSKENVEIWVKMFLTKLRVCYRYDLIRKEAFVDCVKKDVKDWVFIFIFQNRYKMVRKQAI